MENLIPGIVSFLQTFDLGQFIISMQWLIYTIYFVISLLLAIKAYKDASKRFTDKILVFVTAAFVFIFNILGYWVYGIFRPKEKINDQHLEKLEKYFLEYEARGIGKCKVCRATYFPEHTYCTNCGNLVKATCNACSNIIELDWKVCPYCGDKKNFNISQVKK